MSDKSLAYNDNLKFIDMFVCVCVGAKYTRWRHCNTIVLNEIVKFLLAPTRNCLTAMSHKSGFPVHCDGLEFTLPFQPITFLVTDKGGAVCCLPIKKGLSICIMHAVSSWTTAGNQSYNFLKNVNIINIIASFTCAIKDANANVSSED